MRTFRKSLPFIAGFLVFLGLNAILNYLFIPYQFTRLKIHRLETETFQDLVLGSSHGCAGIDPAVLTGQTGRTAFNAAAGGQYPVDNYYLLRDACMEHTPERVIYEYDPAYWVADNSFNRNARYQLDVMQLSSVRVSYFKDLCLGSDFRYVLMPWFLYRDSFGRLRENVAIRQSGAYRDYGVEPFSNSYQTCREDGFTAIHGDDKKNMTVPQLAFTEDNERFLKKNRDYFEKTAKLCLEKGIELVVVTTPVPEETREQNRGFYEEAHRLMEELAGVYGFTYLDYVMPSDAAEAAALFGAADEFSDGEGHMNEKTAERFSAVLAQEL